MAGLFEGAALGAIMGELLNAVLAAKHKAKNFKSLLELLESTLKNIIPRLEEIGHLKKKDHSFDPKSDNLEELVAIVNKGKKLVLECSSISSINVFKIIQHSNALQLLDDSLRRYFTTIFTLDHFINDLVMLNKVKELLEKLIVDNGQNINEAISSQSESESAAAADTPQIREEEPVKSCPEYAGKVYERRSGKKLFLLKGHPYDFDVEDLKNIDDHEVLGKGAYGTSYKCDTKYGAVVIKMLNLGEKLGEREFEERMEEIGKIGSHPNIMVPFGYFYFEVDKFLLYDYVPAGSFKALLEEGKLFQWIRSYWDPRLKIAIGVAKGISHIHSQGGVIHGNIKSSNVLLTEDLTGCISDFGLAPIMNFPPTTSKKPRRFAPEYDAPELKETTEATQKSDVYYFGVMLFETLPTYGIRNLWHPNVISEIVKMSLIVSDCIRKDPNRRPKMDEVVRMLQNIRLDPV